MSIKSKTAYQIYYDEQYKIYKSKGKAGNEATKEIGSKWNNLTTEQRKPYIAKKEEYDSQIKREQQVIKNFQKKNKDDPAQESKEARNSSQNKPAQLHNNSSQSQKTKQDTIKPTLLSKSDKVEPLKKGGIQKVESKQTSQPAIQKSKLTTQAEQKPQQKQSQPQQQQQIKQQQQNQQKQPQQNKQDDEEKEVNVRTTNLSVYLKFYKEKFAAYKERFPNRDGKELTQAIKEEWKCIRLSNKLNQKDKNLVLKQNKKQQYVQNQKNIMIDGKQVEVPKQPLSSFMRFYKEVCQEIKQENPKMAQSDIAKEASEQWKHLSKEQQEEYSNAFQIDNAEFQKKKQEFQAKYKCFPQKSNQKEQTKTSKNFIIIDDKKVYYPIRLSGYYVFQKAALEQLKERQQKYNSREVSSFIGQQWKLLPFDEKNKYQKQSEIDYNEQKEKFIKQYGQFPEKPERVQAQPTQKVQIKKEPAQKPLNVKRPAPTKKIEKKPEISIEEKEELLNKKHKRNMQINYDDVESEIDDILSENESNQDYKDEEDEDQYGYSQNKKKVSLKTKDEEEFDQVEKFFTKNKKIKTEEPQSKLSRPVSVSVSKSKNTLFDMLNQPIPIPDFIYGPNFF